SAIPSTFGHQDHQRRLTMPVTDLMRTQIRGCLNGLMGEEMSDIMMELLPPVGWGDVVRRQDVSSMHVELRAEVAGVRHELENLGTELQAQIAEARTETKQLGMELRAEIAGVRHELENLGTELRAEIAGARHDLERQIADLRAEMRTALAGVDARFQVMQQEIDILKESMKRLHTTMLATIGTVVAVGGTMISMLFQMR
ncbi:MAG: hypothetical protein ACKORY_03460, partial [Actinomycetota bacterium]